MNNKRGFLKKGLSLLLAALLVLGVFATYPMSLKAADQTANGAEGWVDYHHTTSGSTRKWVTDDKTAGVYQGKEAPALGYHYPSDSGGLDVYCINPDRSAADNANWNMNFRWRWNLKANAWLFDNSRNLLSNKDYAPYSGQLENLAEIIYYGQRNGYGYDDIQNAVFWFVVYGNGSAPDYAGKQYQNGITEAYKAGNTVPPASWGMYMYVADSEAKQSVQNTVGLVVWEDAKTEPEPREQSATVRLTAHKTIDSDASGFDQANGFAFRMYMPKNIPTSIWSGAGENDGTDGYDGSTNNGGYNTRKIEQGAADADAGDINFGELRFTENDIGEYVFKFRELKPNDPNGYNNQDPATDDSPAETSGMTYDDTQFTVTIKVEKDAEGNLKITQDGKDVTDGEADAGTWDNKTANAPTRGPIDVKFQLKKEITGTDAPDLEDGWFEFELSSSGTATAGFKITQPKRINTVDNGEGKLRRPLEVNFTKAGEYEFTLKELENSTQVTGGPDGVKTDATPKTIKVVIENDASDDTKLNVASVTVDGTEVSASEIFSLDGNTQGYETGTFTNTYEKPPAVPKIVNTTSQAKKNASDAYTTGAKDTPATLTYAEDETVNAIIADDVEITGLDPNDTYTLLSEIWYGGAMKKSLTTNIPSGTDSYHGIIEIDTIAESAIADLLKEGDGKMSINLVQTLKNSDGTIEKKHNGGFRLAQERVTITADSGTPEIKNTTAKVNGKTKAVELASGEEGTFTDEVEFGGLNFGTTYRLVSKLLKDGEEIEEYTEDITRDTSSPLTVTFEEKVTEAGTYAVKTQLLEVLSDDTTQPATEVHNDKLNVASEIVKVTVKERTPSIKTTVTADGVEATSKQFARLTYKQVQDKVEVTDTIAYKGLLEGVGYHVIGTLVEVDVDGKIVNKAVTEPAEDDFTADGADGSFDLNFGEVQLKPYKKYVVFETVYAAGGEDDKATEKKPLKHEDVNDLAQTIMTENKDGYVLGEEVAPTESKSKSSKVGAAKTADTSPIITLLLLFAIAATTLGVSIKRRVR